MKILHTYDDGTVKIAYSNGEIGLLPPIQMIDAKLMVIKGDNTYSITVAGVPAEIKGSDDAHWIRLCGTHFSEILFKVIVNAGMIVAKALGPEAFQHFAKCILPIREIICKQFEKKPLI